MSSKYFFSCPRGGFVSNLMSKSSSIRSRLLASALLMGMAVPAHAALTIEDITWGVKGLDIATEYRTGRTSFRWVHGSVVILMHSTPP